MGAYDDWVANAGVALATVAVIVACVLIHYEGLSVLSRRLGRPEGRRRRKVLFAISGVLLLHVTQIWLFALALWSLLQFPACGSLSGAGTLHLFDAVYFSAMTFTTVGFGDVVPVGPIRFLAGSEGLTGFVLIAWSASFTYLEMERYWRPR